jgi:hypothetical protein
MPLLLSYPHALRVRLLPLAVETMVMGGARDAAERLGESLKDDPELGLAAALLAEAKGETDVALARYDALAAGRDRLVRARAAIRAVELRLVAGRLAEAAAAEALERLIPAWRGDEQEFRLRLRAAELRAHAGAWRAALAQLRETASIWPDRQTQLRARAADIVQALARPENAAAVPPLEFVALAEENQDLLSSGSDAEIMAPLLADKLLALDLPRRAVAGSPYARLIRIDSRNLWSSAGTASPGVCRSCRRPGSFGHIPA